MSLLSILEVLVICEVNRVCHMANWIMSFVCNYGANRACHVANVIMNFVGNHGVNRPCHVANYMQCGNVLACQETNDVHVMNDDILAWVYNIICVIMPKYCSTLKPRTSKH